GQIRCILGEQCSRTTRVGHADVTTFSSGHSSDRGPREICTLSLHDALPICSASRRNPRTRTSRSPACRGVLPDARVRPRWCSPRSEEHTSELQSRENLVCRLLLEKKKQLSHVALAVLRKTGGDVVLDLPLAY